MSSVSRSGLKSRTGDTRSGTVHLRSWRLVTGSSSKLLGTERQTHASCDSISWGGYAVRSPAENLGSTSLSVGFEWCFLIRFFSWPRSPNRPLRGEQVKEWRPWNWWKDKVGSLQSNTGTFSSQVTNCSWSVPSCSQYPPLKKNYWHVPCLQFHGSLQFKAFQSVHVKHEEPEQSGWAHRPSCRSLSESPVSKVSESAEHSKTCFF